MVDEGATVQVNAGLVRALDAGSGAVAGSPAGAAPGAPLQLASATTRIGKAVNQTLKHERSLEGIVRSLSRSRCGP